MDRNLSKTMSGQTNTQRHKKSLRWYIIYSHFKNRNISTMSLKQIVGLLNNKRVAFQS